MRRSLIIRSTIGGLLTVGAVVAIVSNLVMGANGSYPWSESIGAIVLVTIVWGLALGGLAFPDITRAVDRHVDRRERVRALGPVEPLTLPLRLTVSPAWGRLLGSVLGIGLGSALLVASVVRAFPLGEGSGPLLTYGAAGVVGLVFGWRWFRCTLLVDDERVVVRNPFRSRTLAWSEISGLKDGLFRSDGGEQWILVIEDRRGRSIKPLASLGQLYQSHVIALISEAGTRHGVPANLTSAH